VGLERDWIGNCPGGGHGQLVLRGTYQVTTRQVQTQQTLKTLTRSVRRGQPLVVALPIGEGIKPERCEIDITGGGQTEHIAGTLQQLDGNWALTGVGQPQTIPASVTFAEERLVVVIR
jgi:hypothetical protein